MLFYPYCLYLTLFLLSFVFGDDGPIKGITQSFVYPGVNDPLHLFNENDLVNVTWNFTTPRLSLYQICALNGTVKATCLQPNSSNLYSWMWLANRDNYIEGGNCQFWLEFRTFTGDITAPGSANNFSSGNYVVSKRYPGEPTLINGYKATSTAEFAPSSESWISASVDWTCTGNYQCHLISTSASSTATNAPSTTSQPASMDVAPPISTSRMSSSIALPVPTSAPPPVSTSLPDSRPGLNAVTKVGIGVGVPLCVSVSVSCTWLLILLMYRRRQRKRGAGHAKSAEVRPNSTFWVRRSETLDSATTTVTGTVAELEGSTPVPELMGTPLCELPG